MPVITAIAGWERGTSHAPGRARRGIPGNERTPPWEIHHMKKILAALVAFAFVAPTFAEEAKKEEKKVEKKDEKKAEKKAEKKEEKKDEKK
jgi:hypothetical protein